jgi:PhoH-like ATPase
LKFDKVYVLDTNIILEDAQQFLTISEEGKNLIILPETVIDELDNKKSGFNEINFQAREFGRLLSDAEVLETKIELDATIMKLSLKNCFIDIISLREYKVSEFEDSEKNDRKILGVAKYAAEHYKNVTFLSNDMMCRIRGISIGVNSESLTRNKESLHTKFIKEFEVEDTQAITDMLYRQISEFDPDYEPQNYCYHIKAKDGNEKLAYIVNGAVNLIEKDTFSGLTIRPLNAGQKFAMAGMLDDRINIAVIEALAGSGKTLLAIAAGMASVKAGKHDKIIYIRNSVESVDKAEEVGFLPGLEEKFRIYNYPLEDTLQYIAQKEMKKYGELPEQDALEEKVLSLKKKYNIETMWNGSIRGRTISNAFVIIDEVQNFAKTSLRTVLSRMDGECKVICIGSNRQIDHPYINKYTNGLSVLIKAAKQDNEDVSLFCTELNKVVRGKITSWTEKIFDDN